MIFFHQSPYDDDANDNVNKSKQRRIQNQQQAQKADLQDKETKMNIIHNNLNEQYEETIPKRLSKLRVKPTQKKGGPKNNDQTTMTTPSKVLLRQQQQQQKLKQQQQQKSSLSSKTATSTLESPSKQQQHQPERPRRKKQNMEKAWKNWLCPKKVPNMEATGKVFQIAQNVFYKVNVPTIDNENKNNNNDKENIPFDKKLTKKYFSHWPGQASYIETDTGKVATFLRTWKCGSKTIQTYLRENAKYDSTNNNKKKKKKNPGQFITSLHWKDFPTNQQLQQKSSSSSIPTCIISSFRDPVSHFISGIGEIEARADKKYRIQNPHDDRYEKFAIGTEERFISFIDFLLRYEWDPAGLQSDYRHVFPQSGHLYTLNTIDRNVTRFVSMKNLAEEVRDSLINTCGISNVIEPPTEKGLHDKVKGLDDFLKNLWTNTTKGQTSKQVTTAFETICLLDAVDYACLASELQDPPPEFCMKVYEQYLYNIHDDDNDNDGLFSHHQPLPSSFTVPKNK